MPGLGFGFGGGRMARNWQRSSKYHPNSVKLFKRFENLGEPASDADKVRYDRIMRAVYPIAKITRFYGMAVHGTLSRKVDWMIPDDTSRDLIPVAGSSNPEPVFEAYRGSTGGAANGGYDTTFNPTIADRGVTMGLDDACMGVYYTLGPGSTAGVYSNGNLNMSFVPRHHNGSTVVGAAIIRVNTGTATTLANDTVPSTARHMYLERSASDKSDLYADNIFVATSTQASTTRSNITMGVCGRKTANTPTWQFDHRQQAFAYFGLRLSAAERTAIHEAMARYMADVGAAVSVLQTAPIVIAHRCSGLVYPEFSDQSYAWAVAAGIKHIEIDANMLSDGAIAVMHDSTVDRTTDGTGSVTSFDTASFKALTIDTASIIGGSYGTLHPPTANDLIDTYNGSVAFHIEAKSPDAMTAVIAKLDAKKARKDQYILYSFSQTVAKAAVDAGYRAGVSATISSDMESIWADGIRYVFIASNQTDDTVRAYVARGFNVIMYNIDRRTDVARLLKLGIRGVYSDDAQYAAGSTPIATQDTWSHQKWMPGMFGWGSRGELQTGGWWGWPTYQGLANMNMGWACPVKSNEQANDFSIDMEVRFHAVGAGTDWFAVWLADKVTGDRLYTNSLVLPGAAGFFGYLVMFRQNGRIQIYKQTETVTSNVLTDGAAFTADGTTAYKVRIRVTPTQIIGQKLDSGGNVTQETIMTDAAYRGGYFSIHKLTNARMMFKGLTVS